jgi:hypothetical protein
MVEIEEREEEKRVNGRVVTHKRAGNKALRNTFCFGKAFSI